MGEDEKKNEITLGERGKMRRLTRKMRLTKEDSKFARNLGFISDEHLSL